MIELLLAALAVAICVFAFPMLLALYVDGRK